MTDEELLRKRALLLARPVVDASTQAEDAIRVAIGGQHYAFALADVERVVMLDAFTPLPHTPPVLIGLVSDRGDVFPVFDAHLWLGRPRATETRRPVLVIGSGRRMFGLAVDAVLETIVIALQPGGSRDHAWLAGITPAGDLVVDGRWLLDAPVFSLTPQGTT